MNVTVRFFASYADSLGRSTMDFVLPDGATVLDLRASIAALPDASRLPPNPLIAINHAYAAPTALIAGGDEIAVIPPVAGG